MELVEHAAFTAVKKAAARVTRHLPAEVCTANYGDRERRFKAALDNFIDLLYRTDVSDLGEDDFDFVEKLLDILISGTELHLLRSSQPVGPDFCEALDQLRTAREGIIRGYPADPRLRPSREEVRARGAERLAEMFRDGQIG